MNKFEKYYPITCKWEDGTIFVTIHEDSVEIDPSLTYETALIEIGKILASQLGPLCDQAKIGETQ